ncbi:MAG TPA: hypothetical protein VM368_04680 [Flavisolibacter sp.]|nr:hypothetical protein [Flavisolibacter sp.]
MDKNNTKFEEQKAPAKNTDNAFVQVSTDGSPSIPQHNEDEKPQDQQQDEPGFENR